MPISNELIDQLLQDCHSPQELLGESGLLKQLTKRLAERVLQAEMEIHLGYAKHDPAGNNSGNSRNGKTSKSVRSQNGEIELDIAKRHYFDNSQLCFFAAYQGIGCNHF